MPTEVKSQSPMPTTLSVHLANKKNGFDPMNPVIPGYDNGPSNTTSSQPKAPQDRSEINQPKNDHSQTESMMQTLRRRLGF